MNRYAKELSGFAGKDVAGVSGACSRSGREISCGDADAFAARGARDDAGASGEDSGSESGGSVEAGTARRYVREHAPEFREGMGGELKITARFPEGTVEINQFEDVKKAAGE